MSQQSVSREHQPASCAGACRWCSAALLLPWSAQVIVALILAQTLYFKLTYGPETQVIFGPRGGRPAATAIGIAELVCVILLLIPRTAAVGAALSLLVIGGAIFTHLTSLGVSIPVAPGGAEKDGGLLFGLALAVAIGSIIVLAHRWRELPLLPAVLRAS